MARILAITDKPPITSKMPGNPRFFELCKGLSKNNEIHLILISVEQGKDLDRSVFHTITYLKPNLTKEGRLGKIFRHLFSLPSFIHGFENFKERNSIRDKCNDVYNHTKFDGIYVDGLRCYQYLPKNLRKLCYLDLCDSISKLKFREFFQTSRIKHKFLLVPEITGIYLHEFLAILTSKKSGFISGEESTNLNLAYHLKKSNKIAEVIPQGVDLEEFEFSPIDSDSKILLFFGALDYAPNTDAVIWFANEIFPEIAKNFPDLKFHIVGRSPCAEILGLNQIPNIHVFPDVPKIQPFLDSSRALVVPLRFGAGVKNKILVTGLVGRPIVSSKIGVEGLDDFLKNSIYIANTKTEYVDALNKLFSEYPNQQRERIAKISNFILEKYTWENCAKILEAVLLN